MVEQILQDFAKAEPAFSIVSLRYFNPVGAHESGLMGEDPSGIPNNLLPYIAQVAVGKRDHLSVFGGDYPTKDGTGVRDYIHVMDLAQGHLAAMDHLKQIAGFKAYNLGSGVGHSVLEMVHAFEKAAGVAVPYQILPRRAGDLPAFWADVSLAKRELGWEVQRGLDAMMRDTWNWQSKNPQGYAR
ncbi:UDP-glucose 4-epimerase [Serratia plymuthica A30]|nr:GDP-mannose 4,6-dehydratase [Serratia plymuthica]EKF65750.1 UDP-glucose 4-epimerase [Serratia plymuthica A30]